MIYSPNVFNQKQSGQQILSDSGIQSETCVNLTFYGMLSYQTFIAVGNYN